MAEGPSAPLLRAVPGGTMGETIPPESKSQLASARAQDPHQSVTIAPPAPNFEEMLRQATPVPSLSQHSDQHFRTAIDASARTGSSLGELSKMVAELSSGVVGARRANEQLAHELSTLRALLGSANEQQLGTKRRMAELEQELLAVRAAGERERKFLTDQHDDFLAALLEEHEEALAARDADGTTRTNADVSDLAQKLVQAESLRAQAEAECERLREALAKANAQRDEAQARAAKRERERDELRAEASQLRARLGTLRAASTAPPPPVGNPRPPSYHPPPALRLDASELDSTLHARPSQPRLPSVMPRLTPPPAEFGHALSAVSSNRPASASAFPRVSTRPGVGGPKPSEPPPPPSFGPAPTGWTPAPPAPVETPVINIPARTVSAASLPPGLPNQQPALKQKPDPTTRPLIGYSLGEDGVKSETLEGARLSSKPPKK
jgi:hypothetical protein